MFKMRRVIPVNALLSKVMEWLENDGTIPFKWGRFSYDEETEKKTTVRLIKHLLAHYQDAGIPKEELPLEQELVDLAIGLTEYN